MSRKLGADTAALLASIERGLSQVAAGEGKGRPAQRAATLAAAANVPVVDTNNPAT